MEEKALNELLTLPKPHFDPDLPLDSISLNPYQPRDPIGEEDIEGMKAHIRSGILEPIIVHRKEGKFELIAGLTGVGRTLVTNRLALLNLPDEVKKAGRPSFSEDIALREG